MSEAAPYRQVDTAPAVYRNPTQPCGPFLLRSSGARIHADGGFPLETIMATRYGKTSQRKVKRAMEELKSGTLRSGRSGAKVKSRKQAIAIGLSEARRAGAKVPKKKKASGRAKRARR